MSPIQTYEPHTDAPDLSELAIAYADALPVTEGDRVAAAVLAVGAVLADALQRGEGATR